MYIHRTGSNGAIESITRFPRESEVRSPVARHGKGGCILRSPFLCVRFFSRYVSRSIMCRSACGNVSFKLSFSPLEIQCMIIRFVILGYRFWFCLFPVFALRRCQTCTSWFHSRRTRVGGIWRHCVVYGIGQFNGCEGMYAFVLNTSMRAEADAILRRPTE